MNQIAKEMAAYIGLAKDLDYLQHTGTPQMFPMDPNGSGRYREGTGENPYQHSMTFLSRVAKLESKGWKPTTENVFKEFGIKSLTEYKREISLCKQEEKLAQMDRAYHLRFDLGHSNAEVERMMGVDEGTLRGWYKTIEKGKQNKVKNLSNDLKNIMESKSKDKVAIDIGKGVEKELNISRNRLDTAAQLLEHEGYKRYNIQVPQPTNPGQNTTMTVLAKPGVTQDYLYKNLDKIDSLKTYISRDLGETIEKKFHYPESMDSKRLAIRYAEDGGTNKDGVMEIRRGVPDLDLGGSHYAQVRILVDGTHYLKGMCVYANPEDVKKWPKGVDIMFNTNKSKEKSKMEVLKKITDDPENPFGAIIKEEGGQYWYDPKTGLRITDDLKNHKDKKLGLINKKSDEGDWTQWKDKLPSQFLSKQPKKLIEEQLQISKDIKKQQYEEIMSLTNPTLKKHFLQDFANKCDSEAKDLKAIALPGQKYQVILPVDAMGDKQIYAPNYANGTKLALVRYPHAGTFEIPILTVNNNNPEAKKMFLDSKTGKVSNILKDCVGISHTVAEQLSGADFDGDTVACIPTDVPGGRVKISSRDYLKGLKNWDDKLAYGPDPDHAGGHVIDKDGKEHWYRNGIEYKPLPKQNTNREMGKISNLITDMTLVGATDSEMERAVKHSMVIIDAAKHHLDYMGSEKENNIDQLKRKYQPKFNPDGSPELDKFGIQKGGGASTIISLAKNEIRVPKRRGEPRINEKGKSYYNPDLPEGALIYFNANDKDLYYPKGTYDKDKGTKTLNLSPETAKKLGTKTITYNYKDSKDREKYEPVIKRDSKTGEVYMTNKKGDIKYITEMRTDKIAKMDETRDAMTLVRNKSDQKELLYADYANSMKALANQARKASLKIKTPGIDKEAKKKYAKEVEELEKGLNKVYLNKPMEREAIRRATVRIKDRTEGKNLEPKDVKKIKQQEMTKARNEIGTVPRKERMPDITDKQWEAIQSNAIGSSKLMQILKNTDSEKLYERAMPKDSKKLTTAQISRIKAMINSNRFTASEIALKMHVSVSTIQSYMN